MYSRPSWLTLVENVPPPELHSMRVQTQSVKNPYPSLVRYILKRYPDLRFQDLYVEGNDWSQGNDTYRDDHPVMQFAARQLQLMNQGYSRRQAFDEVETWFNDRRKMLELQQKLDMASTVQLSYGLNGNLGQGKIRPLFNTGQAYLLNQVADRQMRILQELNIHLKSKIAAVGSKQMDAGTFSSADIDKVKEVSFDPTSRILAAMTNQPGKRTSQSLQETTRKSQRHASSALRAALKLLAVEKKSTVGGEASPITLQDLEKISSVLEEIDESTSAADIILSSEFQQKNRKQSEITEAEASKEQLPTSTNSTSSTSINGTAIEKPVVKSKKLSREEKLAQIEAELLKVLQSDEYDDEDDVAESQNQLALQLIVHPGRLKPLCLLPSTGLKHLLLFGTKSQLNPLQVLQLPVLNLS